MVRKDYKHSEETKKKISDSHKRLKHSKESKIKIGIASKGRKSKMKGKNLTKEWKDKISKSNKGKKRTPEFKENVSKFMKGRYVGEKSNNFGKEPWNKGLNKETDKRVKQYSESSKKSRKGIKVSDKTKEKLSKITLKRIKEGKHKTIFKKGNRPWNYIDGRSHTKRPFIYGEDWNNIRMEIYKRDNFTCQKCKLKMNNKTGAFDIHHKIPFLISFNNSHYNLITLCRSCHMKEEHKIIKKIKQSGVLE